MRVGHTAGEQQVPWGATSIAEPGVFWLFLFCPSVGGQVITSPMLSFPLCQKKNDGKYQEMGHLLFIIALRKKKKLSEK